MGLPPPIINEILTLDQNACYNLRSGVTVTRWDIRTNKFVFDTISTIGAVLLGNLPNDIKHSDGLNIFYGRLYASVRYLIFEYLQVLNEN